MSKKHKDDFDRAIGSAMHDEQMVSYGVLKLIYKKLFAKEVCKLLGQNMFNKDKE